MSRIAETWWRVRIWWHELRSRTGEPHVWSWWEETERPASELFSDETIAQHGRVKRVQVRRCARCGLTQEASLRVSVLDRDPACTREGRILRDPDHSEAS